MGRLTAAGAEDRGALRGFPDYAYTLDALARTQAARGRSARQVLAWALERTGHCGEAQRYSRRALRLGTLDALKMFHRGMIERCLGDRAAAKTWFTRAMRLNPRFSLLWSPLARRYAE